MKRSAFTLLELLAAVTLLGLVAATVSLAMRGRDSHARLYAAADIIRDQLDRGQLRARIEHRPCWLEIDPEQDAVRLAGVDFAMEWTRLGVSASPAQRAEGAQVTRIRINPVPISQPWAIDLEAGQHAALVVLAKLETHLLLDQSCRDLDWQRFVERQP